MIRSQKFERLNLNRANARVNASHDCGVDPAVESLQQKKNEGQSDGRDNGVKDTGEDGSEAAFLAVFLHGDAQLLSVFRGKSLPRQPHSPGVLVGNGDKQIVLGRNN